MTPFGFVALAKKHHLTAALDAFLTAQYTGRTACFPVLAGRLMPLIAAMYGFNPQALERFRPASPLDTAGLAAKFRGALPVTHPGWVVVLAGSQVEPLAAFYALIKGRSLGVLNDWSSLSALVQEHRPSSVLVCAESWQLPTQVLITLLLSVGGGRMDIPLGLLCGRDLESIVFLVLKQLVYPTVDTSEILVLDGLAEEKPTETILGQKVFVRPTDTDDVDTLRRELRRLRNMAIYAGHGHEDCLFFGKATILPHLDRQTAACLSSPAEVCPQIIFTDEVRARVLFANTCNGLRLTNGLIPDAASIGLNIIESWPSHYISTTFIKDNGTPESQLLPWLVSSEPMSVGTLYQLACQLVLDHSADYPSYMLVGDPEAELNPGLRRSPNSPAQYVLKDEELVVGLQGGGPVHVCLRQDGDPHLATRLAAGPLALAETRLDERSVSLPCEVHYFSTPKQLFLMSRKALPAGRVEFIFAPRSRHDTTLDRFELGALATRLEHLGSMKLFDHKYKGLASEATHSLKPLGHLYRHALRSLRCAEKLAESLDRAAGLMKKIQRALIESYLARIQRGAWIFSETYNDDFIAEERGFSGRCTVCRTPLLRKCICHPLHRSLRRELLVCARCGTRSDLPLDGFSAALQMSEAAPPQASVDMVVAYENKTAVRQWVTCGLGIEFVKATGIRFDTSPVLVEHEVGPRECTALHFTTRIPPECPTHCFHAKGFLLANLQVGYVQSVLCVRSAASEEPQSLVLHNTRKLV